MKKTLMVISFALCASFAFAQTKSVAVDKHARQLDNATRMATTQEKLSKAGYTGSIFTKTDTVYTHVQFTAAEQAGGIFTCGGIPAGSMVDGTIIPAHGYPSAYATFHRIPDSAYIETPAFQQMHPVIYSTSRVYGQLLRVFAPETRDNGFVLASMIDGYAPFGGDGENQNYFDTYVRFMPVDLTSSPLACVTLYQVTMKFNQDATYIDWSLDNGQTWHAVEFNIKNVDINSNSYTWGVKRITLPRAVAQQPSVTLRLRYVDESGSDYNGGYFYAFDDFKVVDAPDYRLRFTTNQYFEGFFQLMPQNLQVPVVWVADFVNEGIFDQTNVTGKIYTMAQGEDATVLAQKNLGTVVADHEAPRSFVIDPLAYFDSTMDLYNHGYVYYTNDSTYATGEYRCLPTTDLGAHYFFSDVTSNYYTNHIGDSTTFDTIRYQVNWKANNVVDLGGQSHPAGIWGRDNGVLTYNGDGSNGGNYYTPGRVAGTQNVWTDDWQETEWNKAGYGNGVRYFTGNEVPAGWRILGVELVASTVPDFSGVGATLVPFLIYDSVAGESWWRISVNTGAGYYTVQESDINPNIATEGYRTFQAGYNTVRILFPNQPELKPLHDYLIGYRLAEDADFCVAETRTNFVRDDSTHYFSSTPGMTDYKRYIHKNYGDGNANAAWTWDPRRTDDSKWATYPTSSFPMIRMIVGPSYYIQKHEVRWECDNEEQGQFWSNNGEVLCGESDSIAAGYPISFTVEPEAGYEIDRVLANGEEIEFDIETTPDGIEIGVINIDAVESDMVFKCFFKAASGFDPIANRVNMKLQPNPASSNVFISLSGVTGNVDMALIDMSGRVVTTSQFVAENGTNVNVSNLAKGAYFVRITNNQFTKIEKLIVR
ncbi:MAG: T9SS type A sorting domain-containing protein [Bacteroidales bacterium]|nr:T9SS type A sorting domain-containing protein [Bacteroidales bacterium]